MLVLQPEVQRFADRCGAGEAPLTTMGIEHSAFVLREVDDRAHAVSVIRCRHHKFNVTPVSLRVSVAPTAGNDLAVALGANRPSAVGSPRATLLAVRPLLEEQMQVWSSQALGFRWSELHDTTPVGGPPDQPCYCNAVLLVERLKAPPGEAAALQLLDALQGLEQQFGRDRSREQRWGPRSLDLDLLFWGEFRLEHPRLLLPHPRLHLRTFVLAPLLEAMQGSASR